MDYAKAKLYWNKACDAGLPRGCERLAWLYHKGKVVARNETKVAEYMEKACRLGSSEACNGIGVYYEQGVGVTKDPNKALRFYR